MAIMIRTLMLGAVLLASAAQQVRAEPLDSPAAIPVALTQDVEPSPAPSESALQGTGLPARAPEPRTLHDFWPVFVGFALTWVGIVAYTLSFGRRMRRVVDAMSRLDADRSA